MNEKLKYYKEKSVINDVYFKYKFENRYPVVVLQIKVDPTLTDVNIHPSKMDIKFSNFSKYKTKSMFSDINISKKRHMNDIFRS